MPKRMTVVFHDEALYTDLKVEAARRHTAASEIVAAAVREWLELQEDKELLPFAREARRDYEAHGGIPLENVLEEVENSQKIPLARSR